MALHILMAEDDPDIQLVAGMALRKAGFTVTMVNTGLALLQCVKEARPDAVLLDGDHGAGSEAGHALHRAGAAVIRRSHREINLSLGLVAGYAHEPGALAAVVEECLSCVGQVTAEGESAEHRSVLLHAPDQ